MKNIRLLVIFLSLASVLLGQDESKHPSLVREPVVFAGAHDPRQIVLKDGRKYDVRLDALGGVIPENWKDGDERLILDYDEERGAALVHMITGKRLPVVGWEEGQHPIEILLSRDFEADTTNLGVAKAYADGTRRWELEVTRLYAELALHPATDREGRKLLRAALQAWQRFNEAEQRAYLKLSENQDGTRWIVMTNAQAYGRAREQAHRLLAWWGELRLPEPKPDHDQFGEKRGSFHGDASRRTAPRPSCAAPRRWLFVQMTSIQTWRRFLESDDWNMRIDGVHCRSAVSTTRSVCRPVGANMSAPRPWVMSPF